MDSFDNQPSYTVQPLQNQWSGQEQNQQPYPYSMPETPPVQPYQPQAQNMTQNQHSPTMVSDLVGTIVSLVLINQIFGIISAVCLILGEDAWKKQDYKQYESCHKIGKIFRIVGYILFVIVILLVIGYFYLLAGYSQYTYT